MIKHPPRLVRTSSDLKPEHWMARQLPPGTSLRGYAEDRAISALTRVVQEAIDNAGLSRADVARVLGTTKSYISQVLNGSTNMTLKTLGALLWATGRQVAELRTEAVGTEMRPGVQFTASITIQSADTPHIVLNAWPRDLTPVREYFVSTGASRQLATQ
jgi:predicted XRE-type DNA-binding protein